MVVRRHPDYIYTHNCHRKFKPRILESLSKRLLRAFWKREKFRRKCPLSTMPVLQVHIGLAESKLWWSLCTFALTVLKQTQSFVKHPRQTISRILYIPLFGRSYHLLTSLILNLLIALEFMTSCVSLFHSKITFLKYKFENRSVLHTLGLYEAEFLRLWLASHAKGIWAKR